jgi:tRNA threonylcarbamoyladenosine biosynthesis protein TsaE
MSADKRVLAPDEAAMLALGASLYAALESGSVVYLEGDLGMGKTTLSRGIIQAAGHAGAVKSPTYTLVEPYQLAGGTIYHFDLYRLNDSEELEFMGIRDYFADFRLTLIEWPERGVGFLPPADLVVRIQPELPGRRVDLRAQSPRGRVCLQRLAL